MSPEVLQKAFQSYGYNSVILRGQAKGYRNTSYFAVSKSGESLNLILYKNEPGIIKRIKRIHVVSNQLALDGFPVRTPLNEQILKLKSSTTTRYSALYNYLEGTTIPWEAYTKDHIKMVGSALAKIHHSLKKVKTDVEFPLVSDEMSTILDAINNYYHDAGVVKAMQSKLAVSLDIKIIENLIQIIKLTKKLPNQQPLHMDFVRGNILFSNNTNAKHMLHCNKVAITGIIDLEKTSFGNPIFDIARSLAFLIVDSRLKTETKIRKYFLYSGYAKRGKEKLPNITIKGKPLLDELVTLFLIYDFYKFMKHNPYESLNANDHYIRTRDILIERKVLKCL